MKFGSLNSQNKKGAKSAGFTLVELMVSVSIFAFMTAFLLAKYGNFNRSIFLTNLAYDIALTIRSAQSYGLNVRGVDESGITTFQSGFGVHFKTGIDDFVLYADVDTDIPPDPSPTYDGTPPDQEIAVYTIKRNNEIAEMKAGVNCDDSDPTVGWLDIVFRRPNPDAIISINGNSIVSCAQIIIEAPDGTQNTVEIRKTGQIVVKNQ